MTIDPCLIGESASKRGGNYRGEQIRTVDESIRPNQPTITTLPSLCIHEERVIMILRELLSSLGIHSC